MRVHFSAAEPCILRLGGAVAGYCGEAEKFAEIDAEEQKQAQRLFGHLCLYNRLNVSMSRQKRLLVVAGDSRLLSTELAGRFIPGLVDFYETCQKEGVILQCQR